MLDLGMMDPVTEADLRFVDVDTLFGLSTIVHDNVLQNLGILLFSQMSDRSDYCATVLLSPGCRQDLIDDALLQSVMVDILFS